MQLKWSSVAVQYMIPKNSVHSNIIACKFILIVIVKENTFLITHIFQVCNILIHCWMLTGNLVSCRCGMGREEASLYRNNRSGTTKSRWSADQDIVNWCMPHRCLHFRWIRSWRGLSMCIRTWRWRHSRKCGWRCHCRESRYTKFYY